MIPKVPICLLCAAAACVAWLTGVGVWAAETAPRLALQARLFQSTSGSFSSDVLAPGAPELVNVVARDDPSSASLVTVVISLPAGMALPSNASVRLTARESRAGMRTLADRTLAVGAVAPGGVVHLGFWLQGTGCQPVRLVATLTVPGHARPGTASTTIPFVCGE